MNQIEIDEMNAQIPYDDGKITWANNKGYTSKLMVNLYSHGYSASKRGAVHTLYDDKGHKVTSAYSWPSLLFNTALVMR